MNLALTILIDGLTYASWLFIVALGLTLVFGVLKILNVAHGSFYALGAYAAASMVGWFASMHFAPELSLIAMLLAAVAVLAALGPLRSALPWRPGVPRTVAAVRQAKWFPRSSAAGLRF